MSDEQLPVNWLTISDDYLSLSNMMNLYPPPDADGSWPGPLPSSGTRDEVLISRLLAASGTPWHTLIVARPVAIGLARSRQSVILGKVWWYLSKETLEEDEDGRGLQLAGGAVVSCPHSAIYPMFPSEIIPNKSGYRM